MLKKKSQSKKDIYRLWWEYLRRNPDYKEFCNWAGSRKIEELIDDPNPPEKFPCIEGVKIHDFYWNYKDWGNIHKESFDQFWMRIKVYSDAILDYAEKIEEDIDLIMCIYGSKKNLSLAELRYRLIDWIRYGEHLYLVVELNGSGDLENLTQNFRTLVKAKMQKNRQKFRRWRLRKFPTNPIRYKPLKKYLATYDRVLCLKKKNKKWPQIFADFYPKIERELSDETLSAAEYDEKLSRKENLLRYLKEEYANAKRIISNVGKGEFPGKY